MGIILPNEKKNLLYSLAQLLLDAIPMRCSMLQQGVEWSSRRILSIGSKRG